jgi:hypothetical protein
MRVEAALALAVLAMAPATARTHGSPASARLITYPQQVYFTSSNDKERLSGSVILLILEQRGSSNGVPKSLELNYRKAGKLVSSERLLGPAIAVLDHTDLPPSRMYSKSEAVRIRWPHAYRLVLNVPTDLAPDSLEAVLTLRSSAHPAQLSATIPIAAYAQKTSLIFPFRGKGVVKQAGVLTSGHRNRSGLYAIDVLGLTNNYAPVLSGDDQASDPRNYAGWGREIIAPAAGTVVFARNDHADQPLTDRADPKYFLPQYPSGGDPGNYVIIDHENGEFSMIAHMRKGSVRVGAGDHVQQGQVIGLLGNSGDTTGPHVHYQLQNGPDWERADALPFQFTNVSNLKLGSYFNAK